MVAAQIVREVATALVICYSDGTHAWSPVRLLTSEIIMPVTILKMPPPPRPPRGHAKALPCPDLNQPCRLRIGHLRTIYGLSHSSVYVHLKKGLLPPADGVIGGRQYWRPETIKNHLAK